MKMLFKITRKGVKTLLRGVDFELNKNIIQFYEGGVIFISDLNRKIYLPYGDWIIYTDSEIKCEQFKKEEF